MQVTMTVDWNGRQYPFSFQVAKPGTPAPAFKPPIIEEPVPDAAATPAINSAAPVPASPAQAPEGTKAI